MLVAQQTTETSLHRADGDIVVQAFFS